MALPFPSISISERRKIAKLCSNAMIGSSDEALQEFIHHEVFKPTFEEINHVKEVVNSVR
jgi:hypothetical protein